MKGNHSILKSRVNVWIFLGLTIVLRFVDETARRSTIPSSLPELHSAMRAEPDAFIWHDLISDRYFQTGDLRRSLFHRREALRIMERQERELNAIVSQSGRRHGEV